MGQALGQAVEVFAGLRFDAGERVALGLGFDHADGLAVGVKHVVGKAALERELPNRHAQARRDVHFAVVLHDPAACSSWRSISSRAFCSGFMTALYKCLLHQIDWLLRNARCSIMASVPQSVRSILTAAR